MKDVLDDIERWRAAGKRVAVARVVGLEGSGPRDPGATMVVNEDGEVAGSVSGGCVEGAVLTEALEVLTGDGVPRMVTYGIADEDAFAVGLTCGGTIHVFVESFAPPPRMIIFGAVDFTAALVRVAKILGYHVTVCDARPVFATRQRFPQADDVVVDWPNRYLAAVGSDLGPRDAVCVLTHD